MPNRYDNSVYSVSVGIGLFINIEQDVLVLLCQRYINEKCTGVTGRPYNFVRFMVENVQMCRPFATDKFAAS